MNIDIFFDTVQSKNINLKFDNLEGFHAHRLSNEALFHLPLIALSILLLTKGRRKPKTNEIGQIIGECFEKSFVGFKGSSQHLGWSANLRVRTVKALTFLETAKLVFVDSQKGRIGITDLGKTVIHSAISTENDLTVILRKIERNYRNICVEKQMSLELK